MAGIFDRFRKFKDRKHNEGTYLVYSMGKVGSSSVESSLEKRLPNAVIFHTHFLSDNWLNEILPKQNPFFHGNIRIGKKIRDYLAKNTGKKTRIITLVRDPVIREMSGIFENWKAHYKDIEKVEISELTDRLNKSDYSFCLNWFDTEFKEFTGIDIYSLAFDINRGFQIYRQDNLEILCIQLERLESVFSIAMKEFSGLDINLVTSNVANEKPGNKLYKELKKNYRLPEEKCETVYDSRFMKHFYAIEDIEKFKKSWTAANR